MVVVWLAQNYFGDILQAWKSQVVSETNFETNSGFDVGWKKNSTLKIFLAGKNKDRTASWKTTHKNIARKHELNFV